MIGNRTSIDVLVEEETHEEADNYPDPEFQDVKVTERAEHQTYASG